MTTVSSVFAVLSQVAPAIEQKEKFSYVSWPTAWRELKKLYPLASFKVIGFDTEGYRRDGGLPYQIVLGKYAQVVVEVTVEGLSHEMSLHIKDHKNKPIPLESINAADLNTGIMRCLTKCIALHGLGLHVYEGEDLPTELPKDQVKVTSTVNNQTGEITVSEEVSKTSVEICRERITMAKTATQIGVLSEHIKKMVISDEQRTELTELLENQRLMVGTQAKPSTVSPSTITGTAATNGNPISTGNPLSGSNPLAAANPAASKQSTPAAQPAAQSQEQQAAAPISTKSPLTKPSGSFSLNGVGR